MNWRTFLWPVVAACVAGAILLLSLPADAAPSHVCRQIARDLAGLSAGSANPAQARKFDAAIDRQREQLMIVRDQMRDFGCGSGFGGRSMRQCSMLRSTADRMNRNLDTLQSQRARMGGGGPDRRARGRLLAALDANGCNDDEQIEVRRPSIDVGPTRRDEAQAETARQDERDAAEARRREEKARRDERARQKDLARQQRAKADAQALARAEQPARIPAARVDEPEGRPVPLPAGTDTFQTMCVRTCDGYFFPMSFSVPADQFGRDQKNCEAACPGTEVEVFYGAPGSDDTSQMMSARTGAPYSSLPAAFRHKDATSPRPTGCACNATKNFEVIAGTAPAAGSDVSVPDGGAAPLPSPRPTDVAAVSSVVPDSQSIVTILPPPPKDAPQAAAPPPAVEATEPAAATTVPDDRRVRVVGPTFLPDPEGAINLRGPVRP
jgi:hypothetical protein